MYYIRRFYEIMIDGLCTIVSRIRLVLWGIKYGKCNRFTGRIALRRYPGSTISIGSRCQFLSAFHSNQIGIYSRCSIIALQPGACVEIGDDCGFSGAVILCTKHIRIGNNVRCGANTLIIDTDMHTDDPRAGKNKDVVIEDNVWLGYGVKVLKGVHIGKGSMIGAMSIVTKDVPAGVVAAGNPCKIIREIEAK